MHRRFILLYPVLFILLRLPVHAIDKQREAETLIAAAVKASDIRSPGSPPFHLLVNLKVVVPGASSDVGAYEESWVSTEQWRREIYAGNHRKTEVVVGQKRYLSDDSGDALQYMAVAEWALNVTSDFFDSRNRVTQAKNVQVDGINARCMVGRPQTLCFDTTTGNLLSRAFLGGVTESRTSITVGLSLPWIWSIRFQQLPFGHHVR